MVVVFGGFALADIVFIKSLGVGLAIAVAVDATVVRVLLVPAIMRLMGKWNWWAPKPVARLVQRVGLGEQAPAPTITLHGAPQHAQHAPVLVEVDR
jgi:RND superfamily putative drug exporter